MYKERKGRFTAAIGMSTVSKFIPLAVKETEEMLKTIEGEQNFTLRARHLTHKITNQVLFGGEIKNCKLMSKEDLSTRECDFVILKDENAMEGLYQTIDWKF